MVCRRLQEAPEAGPTVAALMRISFLAMRRSNKLVSLAARDVQWRRSDARGKTAVQLRISDKTHLARNRVVVVPVQESWNRDADCMLCVKA